MNVKPSKIAQISIAFRGEDAAPTQRVAIICGSGFQPRDSSLKAALDSAEIVADHVCFHELTEYQLFFRGIVRWPSMLDIEVVWDSATSREMTTRGFRRTIRAGKRSCFAQASHDKPVFALVSHARAGGCRPYSFPVIPAKAEILKSSFLF